MFLANGLISLLVDRKRLDDYWQHMLREYMDHPAAGKTERSIPLSLYGVLVGLNNLDFFPQDLSGPPLQKCFFFWTLKFTQGMKDKHLVCLTWHSTFKQIFPRV